MTGFLMNEVPDNTGHFYPPWANELSPLVKDEPSAFMMPDPAAPRQPQPRQQHQQQDQRLPAPEALPAAPVADPALDVIMGGATGGSRAGSTTSSSSSGASSMLRAPKAAAAAGAAALGGVGATFRKTSAGGVTRRRSSSKEEQAKKRRERNRVLARRTRLRKKFFFQSLQQQVGCWLVVTKQGKERVVVALPAAVCTGTQGLLVEYPGGRGRLTIGSGNRAQKRNFKFSMLSPHHVWFVMYNQCFFSGVQVYNDVRSLLSYAWCPSEASGV